MSRISPETSEDPRRRRFEDRLLSLYDSRLLDSLEQERRAGMELFHWFRNAWRSGSKELSCFDLVPDYRGHSIYGFEADPGLPSLGSTPIIGAVQDIPFDRPKARPGRSKLAAAWMREQARAFVLDQFLRVTSYDRSQPYPQLGHPTLPGFLELFSWCPAKGVVPAGIRFVAKFFQRLDGSYGRFPEGPFGSIPPVSTLGEHYRWVWIEAELMDQFLSLRLEAGQGPALRLPIHRPLSFLLVPELVLDEPRTPSGLAAFGFFLILLGGRPQTWDNIPPALYGFDLIVDERGRIVARTTFLGRQPNYPTHIPGFDPVQSTIWIPDLLARRSPATFGGGGNLDREYLMSRSLYLYQMILQMLPIWNWIPDWSRVTNEELLGCLDACQPPPSSRGLPFHAD